MTNMFPILVITDKIPIINPNKIFVSDTEIKPNDVSLKSILHLIIHIA